MSVSMTSAARGVQAVAAVVSLAVMLYNADLASALQVALSVVFAAWVAAPYWYLYRQTLKPPDRRRSVALFIVSVACAGFGLSVFMDAFVVHRNLDPQIGLLFLFIPLWQLLGSNVAMSLVNRWLVR